MSKSFISTGIDIGSDSIKILVTTKKSSDGSTQVLVQNSEPAEGMRKGVVVKPQKVSNTIKLLIQKASQQIGRDIKSVYVNLGGSHLFSTSSQGLISVSRADRKISQEDINRVLEEAKTFSLPTLKEVFDSFPKEFIIDGQEGIKEPLGLEGVRLEVKVLVLGAFSPYLENLTQSVLDANIQIADILASPLASARAVLSPKERELGVIVIDIGAGNTSIAVFEEGNLIHVNAFPIGSSNITNDIAIGLKTDIDIAEKIKQEYGTCKAGKDSKKKIEIKDKNLTFTKKKLVNIIKPRVKEVFELVQNDLKEINKDGSLPAGVIITGGGAKLPGIKELAKKELDLPVKIGNLRGFVPAIEDPSWATVCGLASRGFDEREERSFSPSWIKGFFGKIKNLFKIFIP